MDKHDARQRATDLRRALRKKLTSKPRPSSVPESPEAIIYRRDLPCETLRPVRRHRLRGKPVRLEEAVEGTVVAALSGGSAYVVEIALQELECDEWNALCNSFQLSLTHDESNVRRRIVRNCFADSLAPEDLFFLDLETTGLASTPVFLVGTMAWEHSGLVVRQYLARNYAEEAAIISLSLEQAASRKLLVSFNGKSFDVPYLRTRAAATGVPFGIELPHFDLLHESRRAWKHLLPDCKLQTLESYICRRPRYGDIPGHEIPDAYHAFVRSGNAAEIVEILKHNMLDLVTLADLMTRLPPLKPEGHPVRESANE